MFKQKKGYIAVCDNCGKQISGMIFSKPEAAFAYCIINGLTRNDLKGKIFCCGDCREALQTKPKTKGDKNND